MVMLSAASVHSPVPFFSILVDGKLKFGRLQYPRQHKEISGSKTQQSIRSRDIKCDFFTSFKADYVLLLFLYVHPTPLPDTHSHRDQPSGSQIAKCFQSLGRFFFALLFRVVCHSLLPTAIASAMTHKYMSTCNMEDNVIMQCCL